MRIELKLGAVRPGDTVERVQISPFGSYPGENCTQLCDLEAFENLVADWRENGGQEILMDFEHASEVNRVDSDTRAAAWIANLAVDGDLGLVGDFRFTDQGADAVTNRRLRFLSPVWTLDADGRPAHLRSVALTNTPNIPVRPILNKAAPGTATVEEQKENPNMDKIKEILGLAPETSEEEVLNAVTALVAKNKEAEQAAAEKEADDFAEANAAKCNKQVLREQYLANKEVAKALVAGIPDAPKRTPQQILNKDAAKTPSKSDVVKELNKCRTPQERIAFAEQHAAEFQG